MSDPFSDLWTTSSPRTSAARIEEQQRRSTPLAEIQKQQQQQQQQQPAAAAAQPSLAGSFSADAFSSLGWGTAGASAASGDVAAPTQVPTQPAQAPAQSVPSVAFAAAPPSASPVVASASPSAPTPSADLLDPFAAFTSISGSGPRSMTPSPTPAAGGASVSLAGAASAPVIRTPAPTPAAPTPAATSTAAPTTASPAPTPAAPAPAPQPAAKRQTTLPRGQTAAADTRAASAAALRRLKHRIASIEDPDVVLELLLRVVDAQPAAAAMVHKMLKRVPQPKPETWKCPKCTLINPVTLSACDVCEQPRPGGTDDGVIASAKRKASKLASRLGGMFGNLRKGGDAPSAAAPPSAAAASAPSRTAAAPRDPHATALDDDSEESLSRRPHAARATFAAPLRNTTPQSLATPAPAPAPAPAAAPAPAPAPRPTKTAEEREAEFRAKVDAQVDAAHEEYLARQAEEASRSNARELVRDDVDRAIKQWATDKRRENIMALLSTLHTVVWDNSGWVEVSIADLMQPAQVKKAYFKAARKLFPDKLRDPTPYVALLSTEIAFTINHAWELYKEKNGL